MIAIGSTRGGRFAIGSVIVSSPRSKLAPAAFASTSSSRLIVRLKAPYSISICW